MRVLRVHGKPDGETQLSEVDLAWGGGCPIPAMAIRLGTPGEGDDEYHPAPRRGLVTPLRGELEICSTDGDCQRFRAGDWLLADDVGTKGHTTRAFGDEVMLLQCAIPDDWMGFQPRVQ